MTVVHFDSVPSTQDVAHAHAAEGAAAGTVIVAEAQTEGRGRLGKTWQSRAGAGIWFSVIERPRDASAIEVLSLRVGLALAAALDPVAGVLQLKWPNDVMLRGFKLGGVLVEARWRDARLEWVVIGVGINLWPPPDEPNAVGLGYDVPKAEVLDACVAAVRLAAVLPGALMEHEVADFTRRDWARGRRCVEPVAGRVVGIDSSGALVIDAPAGRTAVRSGSLVLAEGEGS